MRINSHNRNKTVFRKAYLISLWTFQTWASQHCLKWTFTLFKKTQEFEIIPPASASQPAATPTLSSRTKRQGWLWRWLIIDVFLGEINNSMKLLHHNLSLSICLLDSVPASLQSQSALHPFCALVMHVALAPSPTSTQLILRNLSAHTWNRVASQTCATLTMII